MKIRPAKAGDVMRLVVMLEAQQAESRYAGHVEVDPVVARKMLGYFVQRHGHTHDGGTCLFVAESIDSSIKGFIAGTLSRVYLIGNKLAAQDVFLVADPKAPALTSRRLLDAYVAWAETCPTLFEIQLSHTDALPTGERMGAVYERLGFTRSGGIYRRGTEAAEQKEAA